MSVLRLGLLLWAGLLLALSLNLSWVRRAPAEPIYSLVETYNPQHERHLYAERLADGRRTRLTLTPGDYRRPIFSPDGRWIAYTDYSLYRMPFAARARPAEQLTTSFDGAPSWSPDGRMACVSVLPWGELGYLSLAGGGWAH
ncbi:MAG: hypothetical protein HC915_02705 [Anaerolineae bacterium]|nr:hypothetical protein [Anaerolineae bacterium]